MKTIFTLVSVLLFSCSVIYCQTPLDPPSITSQNAMLQSHPTIFPDTISFTDTSVFNGTQNEFMFGYQWNNAAAGVNKRLFMNCYNTNEAGLLWDANDLFHAFPRTYSKRTYISYDIKEDIQRCFSLQFDPEAPTVGLNDYFEPSSGDTLGAIYGFGYKSGGRRGDSTNTNRYVYTADSGVAVTGRLILSNPIGSEAMQRVGDTNKLTNGTRWFLSINLRRLNNAWDTDTSTSDTVMSIKLPIKYRKQPSPGIYDTLYQAIQFDSISSRNTGLFYKKYYTRGRWMDRTLSSLGDSVFVIRRSMLPMYSDTGDITLSAYFTVADPNDTNVTPKKNPPFRLVFGDVGEIDSIGMEVRYYGKCDIAIDWIRLETPITHALFRGERDSAIAAVVSKAFTTFKKFQTDSGGMPNARLWRFYVTDEPGPILIGGFRYYSSLFEGYCTTEGGANNRFVHLSTKQKNYWGCVPHFEFITKVPFFNYTIRGIGNDSNYRKPRDHTLGYYGGWQYQWNPTDTSMSTDDLYWIRVTNFITGTCDQDYEGSAYETSAYSAYPTSLNQCDSTEPKQWAQSMKSFKSDVPSDDAYSTLLYNAGMLGLLEHDLISMKNSSSSSLFSEKPWLANIWVASEWNGIIPNDVSLKPYLTNAITRPHTGEELRSYIWSSVVFGAKGLMYDCFDNERSDTLSGGSGKLYQI